MNEKIPIPHTQSAVTEITAGAMIGICIRGAIKIVNISSGQRQQFNWYAKYTGEGRWSISGDGAVIGGSGKCAPDSEQFPFSLEPTFNLGLKKIILGWLKNNGKSDAIIPALPLKPVLPIVVPPLPVQIPIAIAKKEPTAMVPSQSPLIVLRIMVAEILPFEGQPREEFDLQEIAELGKSIMQDDQQALISVTTLEGVPGKRWQLVDGERRYRAALIAGKKCLDAIVRVFKNKDDQFWASFISNWNRKGHTPIETSRAIAKAAAAGKSVEQIMIATGKSNCWVYQHLLLQKLSPELQDLMRESVPKNQRLRLGVATILARIPRHEDQMFVWNQARTEPTPGLVKSKVETLAAPIMNQFPQKGRKRKPSDNAERILRVMRTCELDGAFIQGLQEADYEALISGKSFAGKAESLAERIRTIACYWEDFAKKIQCKLPTEAVSAE